MIKTAIEAYRMRCLVLQIMRQGSAPTNILDKAQQDADAAKLELEHDNDNGGSR